MVSYNIDVINHINNNIFCELKPSKIHGIGLFAIRDINAGTNLVSPWQGESDTYQVPLFMVHSDIQPLLWRYFGPSNKNNQSMTNIIENKESLNVKLFKGLNFAYHPYLFINHSDSPNIDNNLTSIRKIKKGEELVRCYYKKIVYSPSKEMI
jgi:SET domain-containing protein